MGDRVVRLVVIFEYVKIVRMGFSYEYSEMERKLEMKI